MSDDMTFRLTRHRSPRAILAMAVILCCVIPAAGQYPTASAGAGQASSLTGSTPSGPASNEVLPLTLRDAIARGLRYNLAMIESGENVLLELMKEGARFHSTGVFTKQVLKRLARKIHRNVQEEKK